MKFLFSEQVVSFRFWLINPLIVVSLLVTQKKAGEKNGIRDTKSTADILNCPRHSLQGVPKKMQHSDFLFRSVPEVQFNISTCVSESEF